MFGKQTIASTSFKKAKSFKLRRACLVWFSGWEFTYLSKYKANKVARAQRSKKLAERKIIELIQQHLEIIPDLPVPFGDDVSGVNIGKKIAVLKTDMLVGSTDVPHGMSLWQAARKAVVMNISDFAAKGVKPVALLVALGLPLDFLEKDVKQLADGLNAGAREYYAYVLGGDTNEASDLIICCSLFGIRKRNLIILRSGARPNDIVAVTGSFGKSAAGCGGGSPGAAASLSGCDSLYWRLGFCCRQNI